MSQNDDDEEIRLRDQLAIAAMQALITKEGIFGTYIDGAGDVKPPYPRTERLCTVAYIIADEMRKARLKSFT